MDGAGSISPSNLGQDQTTGEPVAGATIFSPIQRSHDHQRETADHQGEPTPLQIFSPDLTTALALHGSLWLLNPIHAVRPDFLTVDSDLLQFSLFCLHPPLNQPQFFTLSNFGRAIDEFGCRLVTEHTDGAAIWFVV